MNKKDVLEVYNRRKSIKATAMLDVSESCVGANSPYIKGSYLFGPNREMPLESGVAGSVKIRMTNMILIKNLYMLPDISRDLIEMRDGSLYSYRTTPSRVLKMSDLEPYSSPLPRELALAASHAKPYDAGLRGLQMKSFGLTDCPLKAYRVNAGMTQAQLAEVSGVNSRQIQRIENGEAEMANITLVNAIKISDALGVDAKELI